MDCQGIVERMFWNENITEWWVVVLCFPSATVRRFGLFYISVYSSVAKIFLLVFWDGMSSHGSTLQFFWLWLNFPRNHYSLSLESNSFPVLGRNRFISSGRVRLACLVICFCLSWHPSVLLYQMVGGERTGSKQAGPVYFRILPGSWWAVDT